MLNGGATLHVVDVPAGEDCRKFVQSERRVEGRKLSRSYHRFNHQNEDNIQLSIETMTEDDELKIIRIKGMKLKTSWHYISTAFIRVHSVMGNIFGIVIPENIGKRTDDVVEWFSITGVDGSGRQCRRSLCSFCIQYQHRRYIIFTNCELRPYMNKNIEHLGQGWNILFWEPHQEFGVTYFKIIIACARRYNFLALFTGSKIVEMEWTNCKTFPIVFIRFSYFIKLVLSENKSKFTLSFTLFAI